MLSNTSKYAIRSLIYLANYSDPSKKIGIKKISEDLGIPSPFLSKILQNLAKQKILNSSKGPNGGFNLGKKPEFISLYDIVSIVDGEDFFNNCIIRLRPCSCFTEEISCCAVHNRYSKVSGLLVNFYKETSLFDIIEDSENNGDVIDF